MLFRSVAQLYFEDPVAEIARPVIQLLGFARVELKPGETKEITFTIHTDRLAYIGADYKRIVDPGIINLSIGASRSELFATQQLNITGQKRAVKFDRVMRTPVSIK